MTFHQKCLLKFKTITHLHIGCGRDIGRWEYYFTPSGSQLAFLDYDRLAEQAINNESFIDSLTEAASRDPGGSLQKYLRKFEGEQKHLLETLSSAGGLRSLPTALIDVPAESRSIRRLRLFVGSPDCYIPGSSIKGSLRSAFISQSIKESKLKFDFFPRDPASDDSINLRMLKDRLQKTFRFNSDDTRLFENLIIRDSGKIAGISMGIASIGLFGSRKKEKLSNLRLRHGKESDEYAEVALAGAEFEVELILRKFRRYAMPVNDLQILLEMADRFYRDVWQAELEHQRILEAQGRGLEDTLKFYEQQAAGDYYLLRVGYGAGQMAHSVLLPYREHFSSDFQESADGPLRHASLYTRKKPELKKRQPYPFTARSALAGDLQKWVPLGWLAISKDLEPC